MERSRRMGEALAVLYVDGLITDAGLRDVQEAEDVQWRATRWKSPEEALQRLIGALAACGALGFDVLPRVAAMREANPVPGDADDAR